MGKPRRGDRFWGLSYLRSGIPLRSIPCLGSVVPSVRDSASLHTLPGVCRTFGQGFRFAPYPALGLSYLRSGIPLRSIPCLGSVVPSVRDSASLHTLLRVCRPFGQGFRFAPYPAYGLSYLRSGIPLRSIPCLWSVVPSVRDSASLHTLPGVCRTFGISGFCGTCSRGYALRAPPPAWGLSSLRDCRAAGGTPFPLGRGWG